MTTTVAVRMLDNAIPPTFAEAIVRQSVAAQEVAMSLFRSRHTVGDALSRTTSAVLAEIRDMHEGFEDVARWHAPSECCGIVADGAARDIRTILDEAGLTAEEFVDEVERRTSSKWCYVYGLGEVEDLLRREGRPRCGF
jgi:hypothetical protein